MDICIYASELAVITGHNKYQNVNDIILKLWKKNFKEDYLCVKKNIENLEKVQIVEETNMDLVERISKHENIDLSTELKKCLESNSVCDLKKNKEEVMKKISVLSGDKKTILEDTINHLTNTDFGTKSENKTLVQYQKKTNNKVKILPKFFKKQLFEYEGNIWSIGGRVDGMCVIDKKDTIIEFKNRVNRLFYKLRDYEKVQIYAYMFIHDYKYGQLIENLRKEKDSKLNIIDVCMDDEFWKKEVLEKIIEFIQLFSMFMKDESSKAKMLINSIQLC